MLVTGTDEHGLKIQQLAASQGRSESDVVAEGAAKFEKLVREANVGVTRFVRTSAEEGHRKGVEWFWVRQFDSSISFRF